MVAFTGRCLTHRAEIMWLHGAWPEALEEARRAGRRSAEGKNALAAGEALYRAGGGPPAAGRARRRRGGLPRRRAGRGREPQPGLALLRLAQGDTGAAAAAIRRALDEAGERPRARAAAARAASRSCSRRGDARGGARGACAELEQIADGQEAGMLGAMAALAARRGRARRRRRPGARCVVAAPRARVWQQLEAPYEAAQARDARRAGLPRARRRRHGRVRAGGRARRLRRARRGAGPRARRGADAAGGGRAPTG